MRHSRSACAPTLVWWFRGHRASPVLRRQTSVRLARPPPSYSCVLPHLLSWLVRGDKQGKRLTHSLLASVVPLSRSGSLGALSESVLYLSCQMSQCAHSASALSGSSLGLDRPIVASDLARGVAGRGTSLLLLVPVLFATVARERMRLVAAFSLSLSSLSLQVRTHTAKLAQAPCLPKVEPTRVARETPAPQSLKSHLP